jgi:cell surface protein SprA
MVSIIRFPIRSFSIIYGSDKTSFSTSDENSSAAFDDFRANRLIIANRLATERGIDVNNPSNIDSDGYPLGYGKNNQAVLLPAFMAAYSGSDASGVSTGFLEVYLFLGGKI